MHSFPFIFGWGRRKEWIPFHFWGFLFKYNTDFERRENFKYLDVKIHSFLHLLSLLHLLLFCGILIQSSSYPIKFQFLNHFMNPFSLSFTLCFSFSFLLLLLCSNRFISFSLVLFLTRFPSKRCIKYFFPLPENTSFTQLIHFSHHWFTFSFSLHLLH